MQYLYEHRPGQRTGFQSIRRLIRDLFDRLIVAHATANDAPLITKDELIPAPLQARHLVRTYA
jgi:PIN domain nuclease of toxin-antitoxin system